MMIHSNSKPEADFHDFSASEEDYSIKNGGEQKKKLRPIKLARSPSSKSTRKEKSQLRLNMISSSSSSSSLSSLGVSSTDSISGSSSEYDAKNKGSSEARNNYFQKLPATRPNSEPLKTLMRKPSARFKKQLVRKSVGGAETKNKSDDSLISSRKPTSGNKTRDVSAHSKPKSINPGQRSRIMLTRKPSLKPMRKLAKMATFKSKKISMDVSEFPESHVEKATCSSALKDSKFPNHIELQPGEENESEKIAKMKICHYSYCSLHGHSHANAPPLKRLKSIRKRQKSKKSANEPHSREKAKQSAKWKEEENQATEMISSKDHEMASKCRQVSDAAENLGGSVLVDFDSQEASNTVGKSTSNAGDFDSKGSLTSSTFEYEQMECRNEAGEEIKGGDLEVEVDNSLSRTSSSSSSISLNITAKVEINPKYIRMWNLVHKNVVNCSSNNEENKLPVHGLEKETVMNVGNNLFEETSSSSYKLLSDIDQEGTDDNADAAYKKLELCKNEAIKLVQEAFDKILLPEIQDQSPRNQMSGENLHRRIQGEDGESSSISVPIPTSDTFSVGQALKPDPEEAQTEVENTTSMEEKKTIPILSKANLFNQQAPKRWSNLKKLILLKRFVKALEKVRKINLQTPRYLPLKPDSEGEKVYLKRQTMEEKKNGEEWMLDFALQQVISKLGPVQKKRVSLLVEAFETVLPMPGVETHVKTKTAFSLETDRESESHNGADILLEKLSNMKNIVEGSTYQENKIIKEEHQSLVPCSDENEVKGENLLELSGKVEPICETTDRSYRVRDILPRNTGSVENQTTMTNFHPESVAECLPEAKDSILDSETSQKPENNENTTYQEVSVNGKLLKIPKKVISRLNTELYDGDLEINQTSSKSDRVNCSTEEKSVPSKSFPSETNDVKCSSSVSALLEQTRAAILVRNRATAQLEAGSLQEESINREEIDSVSSTNKSNETKSEEKKNASMWFLIFKHMASSIDAKDGSEPPVDEPDNEASDFDVRKQNVEMKESFANDPNIELQCIEAVRLVNEAIDEIPLPETSSSIPHDQSSYSANLITDQELPQEKQNGSSELFLDHSETSEKTSASLEYETVSRPDEGSTKLVNMNSQEEVKEALHFRTKSNQQVQKNWSNLKKVILLKRFIKAVEKVKKFNPRRPKFLPLDQDAESEKVQLRHQDTEDRKNAEEWMLDYALQQAVARLTPARKRKVELLVQAFETVNPTIRK